MSVSLVLGNGSIQGYLNINVFNFSQAKDEGTEEFTMKKIYPKNISWYKKEFIQLNTFTEILHLDPQPGPRLRPSPAGLASVQILPGEGGTAIVKLSNMCGAKDPVCEAFYTNKGPKIFEFATYNLLS